MINKDGFTLIELMVVMVIIGGLLTLVTVNLDILSSSTRLNSNAREISSTINLAYSQAILTGKDTIFYINLDKNIYKLIIFNNFLNKYEEYFSKKLSEKIEFEDIIVSNQKQTKGWRNIYFSPLGIVIPFVIHIKNRDNHTKSIEVNPISGIVTILDGYKNLDFIEEP